MNKHQREKAKRMKKLASLGVGYHQRKKLLRKYNFQQVDTVIETANIIKKSKILEKIVEALAKVLYALIKVFGKK